MEKCPQHTLQFLTKRASIMYDYSKYRDFKWPDNIIGMVTAENQKRADWCIPYLLKCGFKTTGVSCEPLLEDIDLKWNIVYPSERCSSFIRNETPRKGIDWGIIGCESLPGGRAGRFREIVRKPKLMNDVRYEQMYSIEDCHRWAKAAINIVNQFKTADIPVFVKQIPINGKVSKDMSEFPEDLRIRQWPK